MKLHALFGFGLLAATSTSQAVTNISLDFNGSGNNLAATGFDAVINEDPANYNVSGGSLTINTLPGDMFGRYEADPAGDPDGDVDNVFSSEIDVTDGTVVEARVSVVELGVNFHGGGIWMGVDTDHYVRLGVIHNDLEADGPVRVEFLRENEDLWGGAVPPGPGGDIVGIQTGIGGSSPLLDPIDVVLRIERDGNTVRGFFSLNDGANFTEIGSGFGNFALPGDPQGGGSNTLESDALHVGVFAFGGPDFSLPAQISFDTFTAEAITLSLEGDLNGDGFVGLADLDIVLGNWNANVTPGSLLDGDPSGDGFVGLADLDTVLGNWNAGTPPLNSSVPEPVSVVLMSASALAIGLRRRRR